MHLYDEPKERPNERIKYIIFGPSTRLMKGLSLANSANTWKLQLPFTSPQEATVFLFGVYMNGLWRKLQIGVGNIAGVMIDIEEVVLRLYYIVLAISHCQKLSKKLRIWDG